MKIQINVIGSPSILVEGQQVRLPIKKAEAMLYYLTVEKVANREKLASLFWGTKDSETASNNFRNALYQIRKYLPGIVVISDKRNIGLKNTTSDISIIDNIDNINIGLPHKLANDFLSDFDLADCAEFSSWITATRTHFKVRIAEKLRNRIMAGYDIKNNAILEEALTLLVSLDPSDEYAALELIDFYFRNYGSTKAVSFFQSYKKYLSEEFAIGPSARIQEYIKQKILFNDGINTNDNNNFFVGRADELDRIFNYLEKNSKYTPVVFIDGEIGIGKTYLLNHVLSYYKKINYLIFSTKVYEAGVEYSYSSWGHLVHEIISGVSMEWYQKNENIFAMLGGVFPDLIKNRQFIYSVDSVAIYSLTPIVIGKVISIIVNEIAAHNHTVIVMEDIHLFDKESLQIIEVFLENLSGEVHVFMTCRPEKTEYLTRVLFRLKEANKIDCLHITLQPFGREETVLLCQHYLHDKLDNTLKGYFYKETDGVPLLVAEMAKLFNEDTSITSSGHKLSNIIMARLGKMSSSEKEFLQKLSIFSNGATVHDMLALMDISLEENAALTEGLIKKMLIKETTNEQGVFFVEFIHSALRECIYESIPAFKRSEYHKKIAEYLNTKYSPQNWAPSLTAMMSYHYTKACLPEKVLKQRLREMVYDITLNHDLFPLVQDNILLSCSRPFNDRRRTEENLKIAQELLLDIRNNNTRTDNMLEHIQLEASFAELYGGYLICWGEYNKARVLLNYAMKIAQDYTLNTTYIHTLSHMGHYFLQTDSSSLLLQTARKMLAIARNNHQDKYVGLALRYLGVAFQIMGDYNKAEKVFSRSIEVFNELSFLGKEYTISKLAAECYIGENYQWQGEFDIALEHFTHCVKQGERSGLFWGNSHFRAHLADLAFDLRDWDMMYENIYHGVNIFEQCLGGRCGSMLYSLKAIADAWRKDYENAYRSLEISTLLSLPIQKRTWCAAHIMAQAFLAQMLENGALPVFFNKIISKSAKDYARDAVALYSKIPIPHRVKLLQEKFQL